jgi:hypothetical protein
MAGGMYVRENTAVLVGAVLCGFILEGTVLIFFQPFSGEQ